MTVKSLTDKNLIAAAETLERRIAGADARSRLALQPVFSHALELLKADGQRVPRRMKRLDAALIDEVIEARFDNMPV
ncbi:hypothetical protein [Pukyongiella litopenaei]|uniref:hypothetical protein n=1 Tax=Pukyongiella litopenaei TaxID=2605946 RepID=UPI001FCE6C7B|nr:hypothetical protein [Pukyongiella litopenaei]